MEFLLAALLAIYTKVTISIPTGLTDPVTEIASTVVVTSDRARATTALLGEYTSDPGTIDWTQDSMTTVVCDGPTNCPPAARGTSAMTFRIYALFGIEDKLTSNFAF